MPAPLRRCRSPRIYVRRRRHSPKEHHDRRRTFARALRQAARIVAIDACDRDMCVKLLRGTVANDHFISRFLTAPWEEKPARRLHFYDFPRSAFGRQSSESLFARDGLHMKETGRLLDTFIESPVSHHRSESVRRGQVVDPGKWELYRALVGLVWLQGTRFPDQAPPDGKTIEDIFRDPEGVLNGMATIARERYTLMSVTLPENAFPLFFPDTVYFPIPMVVTRPILAVPLTPRM